MFWLKDFLEAHRTLRDSHTEDDTSSVSLTIDRGPALHILEIMQDPIHTYIVRTPYPVKSRVRRKTGIRLLIAIMSPFGGC